jgi:3D-(3,5/4)-trihydroxycyclohexane-1,2-dione acylhydrolase (decyclizing)
MKTVRLTMAQALVRFLENQYVSFDGAESRFVRGIFMLPGHGNVVGLGQGIEQELKALELYEGKNEQGMAHAAIAFAKQTLRRRIFACTSSIGPGAANMVTAAATATANHIPVLFLPGDIYASRQPDPVLQQIEQPQEPAISTNDAFRPVCRFFDRVNRPEQLMSAMLGAFRVLTSPADTGAVCVALPQDVQAEAYDYPEGFFMRRVHRIARRPAEVWAVEAAADAVAASKKPLLVCGGGVRYSDAAEAFRQFAEEFEIPFGETQAGKSAVPWDHPMNLGGIGVTGCGAANGLAAQADLVIGVGTRFTDFTTASKWLFKGDARFVNINVSEFQALKLDALPVVADAREGLSALAAELRMRKYRSGWGNEIERARGRWLKELERLDTVAYGPGFKPEVNDANRESVERFRGQFGTELTQTAALGLINRTIAPDSVVVGSSGSLPGCMQRMWRASVPGTYNMEYGYSAMGYEISGALGVKLAVGDGREVYALAGDGSFMMLHSELVTSLQENRKINILLFDNGSFGCINNLQVAQGCRTAVTEHRFRTESGKHDGRWLPVDYAKIAEGYGCKGYSVRTMEELAQALDDSKRQGRSTLIDIKVLPKTMTNGYGAWWRVGVAEVSDKDEVKKARKDLEAHLSEARKY